MTAANPAKAIGRKKSGVRIILILILFSYLYLFSPLLAFYDVTEAETVREADSYQPSLEISHSAYSAMVVETGRMRSLYEQNKQVRQNIPAASKIMTALIACERLSMDTQVTISSIAAESESNATPFDGIMLETGDKYALEYLLLRLLFYDSDAAAIAIAEQISNVEETFVELMNTRASSLELNHTLFQNVTGAPVYEFTPGDPIPDQPPLADHSESLLLQYTTMSDFSRLATIAYQDSNFARLIRKDSELMIIDGQRLVSMQNQISSAWTLSEQRIHGAFYSAKGGFASMAAFGRFNDIDIVVTTAGGQTESRISDLLTILDACEEHYIMDTLVESGARFTGDQEQTTDGETFGLVFRKTVYYVRPVDDSFLESTIRYVSFGPHNRPIQRSMTVGQVIFQLKDGTSIAVDVGPDRQILSDITILDHALTQMQNNPNLTLLLFVIFSCLILIMLWHVARQSYHIFKLLRLIHIEKRLR